MVFGERDEERMKAGCAIAGIVDLVCRVVRVFQFDGTSESSNGARFSEKRRMPNGVSGTMRFKPKPGIIRSSTVASDWGAV